MVREIVQSSCLKKIWRGNKSLKKGIRHALWSVTRFILSGWLWNIALRLTPMPEPYKKTGVLIAFISVLLFIWGIRGLWLSLQEFGMRGLCIILGNSFLLLFVFNLITYPNPVPIQERLLPTLNKSGTQIWKITKNITRNMVNAPEDIRFAYTGSNSGDYISGFPTPDPNQKIIVEAASTNLETTNNLIPGGYASVYTKSGASLDCRSGPDLTFPVSVGFPAGEVRLLIIEGPATDKQENTIWWKLHGSQGDGWCKEEFLLPVR